MADRGDSPDIEALKAQLRLEVRDELQREWEHERRQQQDALQALARDLERAEAALRESEGRYAAHLRRDAFHDALTGLPNRSLFLDRTGRLLERARRHKDSRCAVLAIDADRFKVINESLGSEIGDRMLVALARVLAASVREGDTVARLGGDEFGILIEDVRDSSDALAASERIFTPLTEPLRESGHEVFAAVSIGIALSTPDHARADQILRDADTAMYRAKSRGRDRYELFDAAMAASARSSLHLYTEL